MWRTTLIATILGAGGLLLYARTTTCDFVLWDDPDFVIFNPAVSDGVSWQAVTLAFTQVRTGNWIPLTWLSLMLDSQLYGTSPTGYHFTNSLLHALNAVLLFLLLQYLTNALWRSALVAALWEVHPVNVESVAWITERKDVLCWLFWILTLFAYTRLRGAVERAGICSHCSSFCWG